MRTSTKLSDFSNPPLSVFYVLFVCKFWVFFDLPLCGCHIWKPLEVCRFIKNRDSDICWPGFRFLSHFLHILEELEIKGILKRIISQFTIPHNDTPLPGFRLSGSDGTSLRESRFAVVDLLLIGEVVAQHNVGLLRAAQLPADGFLVGLLVGLRLA